MPKPRPVPTPPPKTTAPPQVTAPPPPPAVPTVSAAAQASAMQLYAAALRARVQANLLAPRSVRLLGIGGVSRVAIQLAPSGALLGVSLAKSSGSNDIDNAALKSVRSSLFPPFPATVPQHNTTFVLTVRITP